MFFFKHTFNLPVQLCLIFYFVEVAWQSRMNIAYSVTNKYHRSWDQLILKCINLPTQSPFWASWLSQQWTLMEPFLQSKNDIHRYFKRIIFCSNDHNNFKLFTKQHNIYNQNKTYSPEFCFTSSVGCIRPDLYSSMYIQNNQTYLKSGHNLLIYCQCRKIK